MHSATGMNHDFQRAGFGDRLVGQIVARILNAQEGALSFCASKATSCKVTELLRRLVLDHSQDKRVPCCTAEADLPILVAPLQRYTWERGEASRHEVVKGKR